MKDEDKENTEKQKKEMQSWKRLWFLLKGKD